VLQQVPRTRHVFPPDDEPGHWGLHAQKGFVATFCVKISMPQSHFYDIDGRMKVRPYRGRFAPSPTGPLHFGSLVAAVGSYLEARCHDGEWLLRMEDLDAPRCEAGATDDILRTLEAFGFQWHGEVVYQSRRHRYYRDALERLRTAGKVFPCGCTRQELADSALAPDGARRYPGTCRSGMLAAKVARSYRLRADDVDIVFDDAVQGAISQNILRDVGDFILLRADGIFAYQLAVVVDDYEQNITDIVRGGDLLDSTPRQIFLQQQLSLPSPRYAHLPVAVDGSGGKLSKQTLAPRLTTDRPAVALLAALTFLGQEPPVELSLASVDDLWRWAEAHWQLGRVPRNRALPAPATY
jgi:glutamyl-Q tRNA(Asp) synthetase